MKRTQRSLALLLAFLMLVALLPGGMALAAKWTPAAGEAATSDGFIKSAHSDQFEIGKDSNRFPHSSTAFASTYYINDFYLNRLLSLASYNEACRIMREVKSKWGGACYGVSASMILNHLSKKGALIEDKRLYIDRFQSGAKEYFDLTDPKDNPELLSMINYHYMWQYMQIAKNNETRFRAGKGYEQEDLNKFVEAVKRDVDLGIPFEFGYYYTNGEKNGGHSIVGFDYFEDDSGLFILKAYDLNDRYAEEMPPVPRFRYLILQKDGGGNYRSPYKDGGVEIFPILDASLNQLEILSVMNHGNIKADNEQYNIHNPASRSANPTGIVLQFDNINAGYDKIYIRPFNDDIAKPTYDTTYDESATGAFIKPGEDYLPEPINLNGGGFYKQIVEGSMHYTQSSAGEVMPGVGIEFEMKNDVFTGYDISTGASSSFTVSKAISESTGNYTSIEGSNISETRFDANGALYRVTADDKGSTLSLLFGTQNTDSNYDMFFLSMNSFTNLQIVKDAKHPNDILLHGDGFGNGLSFIFFNDAMESDMIEWDADPDDTWLKISSEIVDGKIEVSVYSAPEAGDEPVPMPTPDIDPTPTPSDEPVPTPTPSDEPVPTPTPSDEPAPTPSVVPDFPEKPDYITIIDDPLTPGGSESSGGSLNTGAQEVSRNEYPLTNGQSELGYIGSGDFTFTVDAPFSKYISTSIDGVPVERQFIDVKEGSTIITIREGFMKTLKAGEHRLRVQFTDGFMQTTLKLGTSSSPATLSVPHVPATGGTVCAGLAMLCTSLVSAAFVTGNKRRK